MEWLFPNIGVVRGSERTLRRLPRPLSSVAGVPRWTVEACRTIVAAGVTPYGAVRVEAVSAGQPRRAERAVTAAPIEVRVVYARADHVEVRQARINCHITAQGHIVALTATTGRRV